MRSKADETSVIVEARKLFFPVPLLYIFLKVGLLPHSTLFLIVENG